MYLYIRKVSNILHYTVFVWVTIWCDRVCECVFVGCVLVVCVCFCVCVGCASVNGWWYACIWVCECAMHTVHV